MYKYGHKMPMLMVLSARKVARLVFTHDSIVLDSDTTRINQVIAEIRKRKRQRLPWLHLLFGCKTLSELVAVIQAIRD